VTVHARTEIWEKKVKFSDSNGENKCPSKTFSGYIIKYLTHLELSLERLTVLKG